MMSPRDHMLVEVCEAINNKYASEPGSESMARLMPGGCSCARDMAITELKIRLQPLCDEYGVMWWFELPVDVAVEHALACYEDAPFAEDSWGLLYGYCDDGSECFTEAHDGIIVNNLANVVKSLDKRWDPREHVSVGLP